MHEKLIDTNFLVFVNSEDFTFYVYMSIFRPYYANSCFPMFFSDNFRSNWGGLCTRPAYKRHGGQYTELLRWADFALFRKNAQPEDDQKKESMEWEIRKRVTHVQYIVSNASVFTVWYTVIACQIIADFGNPFVSKENCSRAHTQ